MHQFITHFTNFKNFAAAQINRANPMTILIGKNGSGKTNLIEGIEVFAHLMEGTPLRKFSDMGKGGYCEVRGGLDNCVRFGVTDFELCFNLSTGSDATSSSSELNYKIKIGRTAQHEAILSEEHLLLIGTSEEGNRHYPIFSAQRSGDVLKVEYDDFTGDANPSISISAGRSVMSRYEGIVATSTATGPQKKRVLSAVNRISDYLKTAYIFDINPKEMRNYERITAHVELLRDGRNLSAVLYALKESKPEEFKRITKFVQELPEESFSKMDFIKTRANDVMLRFHVGRGKANKHMLDARMLSDGTLRILAVLTALETVLENSRIVIEEFDNGLHSSRALSLVKHLYETAERRGLSILVTTHNPAIMNALSEEQMESVVLCHCDKETGHSKLTPLMSVRDIDLMMLRGSLGDLVTDEIVEKYLSPDYRKKRAELARKWKERYTL